MRHVRVRASLNPLLLTQALPIVDPGTQMNDNAWLAGHQADVYSQSGEDGVVGKILELLPARDHWCVEFGAWDGLHLSNSRNLIEHHGYSAVLIEGSRAKYQELVRNYAARPNVHGINAFVGFTPADSLDVILRGTPIPKDFDFLSIDIDGNDYHVWKATHEYRPKLVCIEFNPTIATEVNFVQQADPAACHGASLAALTELGKEKGYELIAVLEWNAFFVRSEFLPLFRIADNSPAALRRSSERVTHIFVGFDGRVFLRGGRQLLWHSMPLSESRVQHLPWWLRRHPNHYNLLQRAALHVYRRLAALTRR